MNEETYNMFDEIVEKEYTRGYYDGQKSMINSYETGLNDAWEIVRKIMDMNPSELGELMDEDTAFESDIINKYSASEVIAKVKEYEEKQKQKNDEIKEGDEIENDTYRAILISIVDKDYANAIYISNDGSMGKARIGYINPSKYKKTGRHFSQVEEILKLMDKKEVEE